MQSEDKLAYSFRVTETSAKRSNKNKLINVKVQLSLICDRFDTPRVALRDTCRYDQSANVIRPRDIIVETYILGHVPITLCLRDSEIFNAIFGSYMFQQSITW